MNDILPKEVREGLAQARKMAARKSARMRVQVGEESFPVLRIWDTGFALDADNAPHMRGLVDLYEGPRHSAQCLVITSAQEGDEMRYEFKRNSVHHDSAPLDFVRRKDAPVALIGQD
ncbi:hypothetical protein RXV86_19145 [Alisedimentitalea sp. MJ-SS2]|uniref:hypothetical protein n=1 Tax=Aliisedimentitalea sp. MJ-SS2 TaxID=3049795 RepID=UPI00290B0F09|nr:hypothetical protein [Alisedimentitalea sp. MJ-SS2]MDU8929511.1 hypothetical protein [Alisedimentitalea sp. MJ-SS2]